MSLCQNVSGVLKSNVTPTQNASGVLKTLTSFKINVSGTLKELLEERQIYTSGTIIAGWQAHGGASILSQDGETVTATVSHINTNTSVNNTDKISSSSFYVEAGTKITFSTQGNSPSGPLIAYLVSPSGNATQIGASGAILTVNTSGVYYLVIVGCGVVGSQGGISVGYTTVTNATFTFSGGLAYEDKSSIAFAIWMIVTGKSSTISNQSGESLSGTIYSSGIDASYANHSIYSTDFRLEAGKTITFTGSISPSGPFRAYLVDSSGNVAEIGSTGGKLTVNTGGFYHVALAGCGVHGSQSGTGATAGTFSASFSIT